MINLLAKPVVLIERVESVWEWTMDMPWMNFDLSKFKIPRTIPARRKHSSVSAYIVIKTGRGD